MQQYHGKTSDLDMILRQEEVRRYLAEQHSVMHPRYVDGTLSRRPAHLMMEGNANRHGRTRHAGSNYYRKRQYH